MVENKKKNDNKTTEADKAKAKAKAKEETSQESMYRDFQTVSILPKPSLSEVFPRL